MRHTIKSTFAALVLSISLAAPAAAGPLEDGLSAYQKGDYATALRLWRPLADQGDAKVQYNLGVLYRDGQGVVKQDHAEAVKWFRKAADQGDAMGQHNLGVMYANGQGVPQDSVQAHMWFNLAIARYSASQTESRNKSLANRDMIDKKMKQALIA